MDISLSAKFITEPTVQAVPAVWAAGETTCFSLLYCTYSECYFFQNGALSSDGDAPGGAGPQVLPGEVYLLPAAFLHHLRHATRGNYINKISAEFQNQKFFWNTM